MNRGRLIPQAGNVGKVSIIQNFCELTKIRMQ